MCSQLARLLICHSFHSDDLLLPILSTSCRVPSRRVASPVTAQLAEAMTRRYVSEVLMMIHRCQTNVVLSFAFHYTCSAFKARQHKAFCRTTGCSIAEC